GGEARGLLAPGRKLDGEGAGGEALALVRTSNEPLQFRGERLDVVRRHEHARVGRYRLRNRARGGADDRHAMGDGLGIGHAVAYEARWQHERIGGGVERRHLPGGHGAEQADAVGKPEARDLIPEPPRRLRVAPAITGNDEPPGQMPEPGERSDQHIVALARDYRP